MSTWGNKDWANNAPKFLDSNYPGNTDIYLVNSTRLSNVNSALANSVAHQGWVKIHTGKGSLETITLVSGFNPSKTYENANLVFTGANTTTASANIDFSGASPVINIFNKGGGYTSNTIITTDSSNANNANLAFSFAGGRIGRDLPETIVALSDPTVTSATSGGKYFPGA